jgi:ADP-ribose pyrophosphatase YjhB (NUDIX family)
MKLRGSKRTRLLVVSGNSIIVTKRWLGEGKWSLPGGGLHREEESLDGALRELHEETGLHLKSDQLRRHSDQIFRCRGLSFNYVLFVAKVGRKLAVKHRPLELTEARWINRFEVSPINAEPDVLQAVASWWG